MATKPKNTDLFADVMSKVKLSEENSIKEASPKPSTPSAPPVNLAGSKHTSPLEVKESVKEERESNLDLSKNAEAKHTEKKEPAEKPSKEKSFTPFFEKRISKKKIVSISLDDAVIKKVSDLASDNGRSNSYIINQILKAYFAATK